MRKKDRYISFENIDCYEDAKSVLDAMHKLFAQNPEAYDKFWERFKSKLPKDYTNNPIDELGRDILYEVCSNVFYIEELFEKYNFEEGMKLLQCAEFDCC